jgi:hypothetical protein
MYDLLESIQLFVEEYAMAIALSTAAIFITIVYHLTH